MSTIRVDYGDEVELVGSFSSKGEPVDPDSVICSVKTPDGSVSHPDVTKVTAGEYRAVFSPPGPGEKEEIYEWAMDGFGENKAAAPAGKVIVRKRAIPRPPDP